MKRKTRTKAAFLPSRWAAYAAAAGATALGAATAEAEIHYSGPIHEALRTVHTSDRALFSLDNGASLSLYVVSNSHAPTYNYAGLAVNNAPVSHGFRAHKFGYSVARRLASGVPVSHGKFSVTHGFEGNIRTFYGGTDFPDGGEGFVGFKFNTGAGTQYGWVRIKLTPYPEVGMVVVDYAYADPGEPIETGQTSSAPNQTAVVRKGGSLGLLALGGLGLAAWRAER